jgi:hypothetical protein
MKVKFLDGTSKEFTTLREADLREANLSWADLREANLSRANLSGANLYGANLSRADLTETRGLEQQTITPDGAIVGYKKLANGTIATLLISAKVPRLNAYGSRKCRAASARVTALSGPAGVDQHSGSLRYALGKTVKADSFDDDRRVECSHGIHFFITRTEAENY